MSSIIDMASGFSHSIFAGAGWVALGLVVVLAAVVVVLRHV